MLLAVIKNKQNSLPWTERPRLSPLHHTPCGKAAPGSAPRPAAARPLHGGGGAVSQRGGCECRNSSAFLLGNAALDAQGGSRGVLGCVTLRAGERWLLNHCGRKRTQPQAPVPVDKGQALVEQGAVRRLFRPVLREPGPGSRHCSGDA